MSDQTPRVCAVCGETSRFAFYIAGQWYCPTDARRVPIPFSDDNPHKDIAELMRERARYRDRMRAFVAELVPVPGQEPGDSDR